MSPSFLEFGSADANAREVYGALVGSGAHECWDAYHYAREILSLRQWAAETSRNMSEFPRREKYFLIWALVRSQKPSAVTELGSSLLELIDGLEAIQARVRSDSYPKLVELPIYGIEKSAFLGSLSRILHPHHNITIFPSVEDGAAQAERTGGVLFDRIVSSSVFQDATSFVRFIKRFDTGILNLLLSREGTFSSSFFGQNYTYFSLHELAQSLVGKQLFHLFGFKAPKFSEARAPGRAVIEGYFFYGSASELEGFMESCRSCEFVASFVSEKQVAPKPISEFA